MHICICFEEVVDFPTFNYSLLLSQIYILHRGYLLHHLVNLLNVFTAVCRVKTSLYLQSSHILCIGPDVEGVGIPAGKCRRSVTGNVVKQKFLLDIYFNSLLLMIAHIIYSKVLSLLEIYLQQCFTCCAGKQPNSISQW